MKTWLSFNWLKLVAILALLGVVILEKFLTLPFAYYQLMNWLVVGASVVVAWQAREQKKDWLMWLFLFVAVVFNPFAPLYLTQTIWRYVDIAVAVLFVASFFLMKEKRS